jgi:hypothetical protein
MDSQTFRDRSSEDEWSFSLNPEDAVVPRYRKDVVYANQPRATRVHHRHLRQAEKQQCRHFWLPRRGSPPSSPSDSEDDAPRRKRLTCRRPEETLIEQEEGRGGKYYNPSLVAQHRLLDRANPAISPHTCSACRNISVDVRRQRAYQFLAGDEKLPRGWNVHASSTGLTYGDAVAAAKNGCLFFSFVVPVLPVTGSVAGIDESSEVTVTGAVQGVVSLGFSVQWRDGKTTMQRHNPTQSLTLYTVPGMAAKIPQHLLSGLSNSDRYQAAA